MSNVKEGWKFEDKVLEILGEHGFWASAFPKDKDGSQPCDIIAVNFKGKHLIDAKDCKNGRFNFERMEDNQLSAIDRFKECSGGRGWFVLGYPGEKIYMVEAFKLRMLRDSGAKSVGKLPDSLRIEVWLREHCDFK